MNLLRSAILALALVASTGFVAAAQDFDDGLDAILAGDFAIALEVWRPLAEEGHADAQWGLGTAYAEGNGVLIDYVRAYMWSNIAGANGDSFGVMHRDEIAERMTTADMSQAQAMARECMSSGYVDCGW